MFDIPFTARISVPDGVLVRELQGESVVLDLRTERYYGLDDTGTRMWNVLINSSTIQVAYDALLQEYDVQADRLRADLERLLEDLSRNGLLELVNA